MVPAMKRSRRFKRVVIGLCAGLIALISALVIAWASGLVLHDSSQAASIKQALRDFRASNHGSGELNGVYLYATSGSESIDALGGASHTYPTTTAVTVVEVPCGLRLTWAALDGRSTTWTFCETAAGVVLRSSDERHTFFGQHDHTTYACSGRVLVPVSDKGVFRFRCNSKSGWESGNMRVLGRETLEVGKDRIQALHTRSILAIHGGSGGDETIDWWIDPSNSIPLRIVLQSRTNRSVFVGRVHYREDLDLRLLSLTPRR
jgi:hypothetical protein